MWVLAAPPRSWAGAQAGEQQGSSDHSKLEEPVSFSGTQTDLQKSDLSFLLLPSAHPLPSVLIKELHFAYLT